MGSASLKLLGMVSSSDALNAKYAKKEAASQIVRWRATLHATHVDAKVNRASLGVESAKLAKMVLASRILPRKAMGAMMGENISFLILKDFQSFSICFQQVICLKESHSNTI